MPCPAKSSAAPVTAASNSHGVTCLKLDGSEVQSALSGGLVRTSTSRLEDGQIITDWKLERDGKLILEGHEIRSLSEDGARLLVDTTVRSARQVTKTHMVMTREE
jgi:hypothetical protein